MEHLLEKYAGRRIPALVPLSGGLPEAGLLNGELVKIYQRGFSGVHSIPLGVLAAVGEWHSAVDKWQSANYSLNQWARAEWIPFCREIRADHAGDKLCESCDRRYAVTAEQEGGVIAYLCDHGLIDFAVPVSIDGRVIAVLFTGQRKPKPGEQWALEFVEHGGVYKQLEHGRTGVDAWQESLRRMSATEDHLRMPHGKLAELLKLACRMDPTIEVTPDDIRRIMAALDLARRHLSDLATATFELEKARVVAWIRSKISESLGVLTSGSDQIPEFWRSVSSALGLVARYFGCTYAGVLAFNGHPSPRLRLLCLVSEGTVRCSLPAAISSDSSVIGRLQEAITDSHRLSDIFVPGLTDALGLDTPSPSSDEHSLCGIVMRAGRFGSEGRLVFMGQPEPGLHVADYSRIDQEAAEDIFLTVGMVTDVARFVEELALAARKQATFVEDVAHDIRNPIQNIVFKAARMTMKDPPMTHENLVLQARRLATQVKRLHMLSERVWTLEELERQAFRVDRLTRTPIYEVLRECRDSLEDSASRRHLRVTIDPALIDWAPLPIDKRLFTQTALNLLDNAIKYSAVGSEIRIDGRNEADTWSVSVVSLGLPIYPDEIPLIFEKFWRSGAAKRLVKQGTGIGLSVVKAFADLYGDVRVKSHAVPGRRDHVTEFMLLIRKER